MSTSKKSTKKVNKVEELVNNVNIANESVIDTNESNETLIIDNEPKEEVINVTDSEKEVNSSNDLLNTLNSITNNEEVLNFISNDEESLKKLIESLNKLNKLAYSNEGLIDSTKPKKSRISFNVPEEGTQSRKIYDYLQIHYKDEKFSIYKVCKVLNTPSNNTNRIYLKFFKEKRENFFKEIETKKEEEIEEIYDNL